MCGRYTLAIDVEQLIEWFPMDLGDLTYQPRFNMAPTQQALTYGAQRPGTAEYMRWGLVPVWAKDLKVGSRMFNARAETVASSGAFRTSFRRHRCLILADGFYEWRKDGATRTPLRIGVKGWEPFGFAGLWDAWRQPDGEWLHSCTIITCEPNNLMVPIHDRMPVILPREAHGTWLDPENQDAAALQELLVPYPASGMEAYQVSPLVNNARNESPECITPVAA